MNDPDPALNQAEVVLVSYKSIEHIRSLISAWPSNLAVVIVDNGEQEKEFRSLLRGHDHVRYLDGGGQGFARAANRGAFSSGKSYVVFVNPDSRPTSEDLATLVKGLIDEPGSASQAATMTGRDGETEIGVGGWEPSVWRTFVFAFGLHKRWRKAGLYAKPLRGEHLDVDWTTGACMAVRRSTFADLGGFDEAFFVYSEDTAFGRRAREAGTRSILRSDVLVPHAAGSSGAPSLEMFRLRGASFAGYVGRYHDAPSATVMRLLLVVGSVLRAIHRRLNGDRASALAFWSLAVGTATGRAYVGDREVANARLAEVTARSQ